MTSYRRPAHISVKVRDDFFYAVRDGDFATVRKMLDEDFPINTPDGVSDSALIWACRHGQKAMAHLLIDEGIDIHATPPNGTQAICVAAKFLPEVAKRLVELGADVNANPRERSLKPLLQAIEAKHNDLAQFLIAHGADVNADNDRSEPAVLWAALHNREMVHPLIEAGAEIELPERESMVHKVLYRGIMDAEPMLSAVLILLGAGADRFAENKYYGQLPEVAYKQKPSLLPVIEKLYHAPDINADALNAATMESLLSPSENSLLDNPRTWWHMNELASQLRANGETLDVRALEQAKAPDENGYLEYGVRCASFKQIHAALAANGISIPPDMLVDWEGNKTRLLQRVIDNGELPAVFSTDYWQDHPLPEMKRVWNALSEEEQAPLPYHQLVQWKGAQERTQMRGLG